MMMTLLVVAVVSGALVLGAIWGLYGKLPDALQGFLIALAGGALIVSITSELVEPALEAALSWIAFGFIALGALVFTGLDYLVDEKMGAQKGGGLLLAITLDGIPENLALGAALIGAGPMEVAALAGSILLSNLPEAAGGAKQMCDNNLSRKAAILMWGGAALLLSAAALGGNLLLAGTGDEKLALIRCFAAGAVVASLATEVFPQAFKKDTYMSGIAVACGLILAFALEQLGG